MAQMTPGNKRHPSMQELQESLEAMRHEQEELADEIRVADAESKGLSSDLRKIMGGPLEDPEDSHRTPRG